MLDEITINSHSSIRIGGEKVCYFDPFEVTQEAHDADVIFITHEHFDHFEEASIVKLMKPETWFVVPEGMAGKPEMAGAKAAQVLTVKPGEDFTVCGLNAGAVHAYNMEKPYHPAKENWCGYTLQMNGKTYYVCGDTDATPEAQAVRCDVLLIPIGGTYTMDPCEAADLVDAITPKYVVPTHYGSIVGSMEDADLFEKAVAGAAEVVRKIGQ